MRSTIEITPPELVADLMYRGIALAGGGALLRGLDRRLAQETKFPVYVAEDPLTLRRPRHRRGAGRDGAAREGAVEPGSAQASRV